MKSIVKKCTYNNPILIMIVMFIIAVYGVGIDVGRSWLGVVAKEIILGVTMFSVLCMVAGKETLIWKKKSGRFALLSSLYSLIVAFLLAIGSYVDAPKIVKSNGLQLLIILIIYTLSIGLFEEGIFRGIIMNGLIKIMPKTKVGLWWAVIISSFIFGFVHVMYFVPYISENPVSIIAQMLNKTIQAGAIGILYAAIYLKTKNIWTCVVVHAVYDLILLLPQAFTSLGSIFTLPQYVYICEVFNKETFIKYAINILISIPDIVIAIIILRKLNPQDCVIWK